jgi:hypothetical protein
VTAATPAWRKRADDLRVQRERVRFIVFEMWLEAIKALREP